MWLRTVPSPMSMPATVASMSIVVLWAMPVIDEMSKKGIAYDHIYCSFERHMKCGMGKCGHCQIGHQYVCIDGPVFNYWEAKNIQGSM